MTTQQKTILITGATGTMGQATLKQFLNREERFKLKLFVHDTKADRRIISRYRRNKNIDVIYGDLKNGAEIEESVRGVDYVLHIGAMVSPAADQYPAETLRVNYGSTVKIIDAIKQQPNRDEIGLVFIGTIAETGCRRDPIHWGRVGDPIKPSMFDYYAVSKVAAERAVFESGLKKWVSIRQTGMLPTKSDPHPIAFHQNMNNVLEWVTAEESGLLMANICEDWIPESFWRKAYNVGGGEAWRMTAWEFTEQIFKPLRRDFKQILDPRDFALYNFHGHWFTDSDALNEITQFRSLSPEQYFEKAQRSLRLVSGLPLIKRLIPSEAKLRAQMDAANGEHSGTRWMVENEKAEWIAAFFGSNRKRKQIKSWGEGYVLYTPDKAPTYLDHGYDETIPIANLSLSDMQQAARFRGGICLSADMRSGDLFTSLQWRCHARHPFDATPNLILKGGHWCPECARTAWDHAEVAKHSPFFAQVWTPLHGDEDGIRIVKEFSDATV